MSAFAIEIKASVTNAGPPPPADLCNLLQIAASALHLIDRQLDDELRPLIRIGLAAIRQAAGCANAQLPDATAHGARRIA